MYHKYTRYLIETSTVVVTMLLTVTSATFQLDITIIGRWLIHHVIIFQLTYTGSSGCQLGNEVNISNGGAIEM